MLDPRIFIAITLVCLVGFVLLARKAYLRRKKRILQIRHAGLRFAFVLATMDRRYSVNGEGEIPLDDSIRMEIYWREHFASGGHSYCGTRVTVRGLHVWLNGMYVYIQTRSNITTGLPLKGNSVLFQYIRPEDIQQVWFETGPVSSINSLGQTSRKENE